jgi:hypothetical protein
VDRLGLECRHLRREELWGKGELVSKHNDIWGLHIAWTELISGEGDAYIAGRLKFAFPFFISRRWEIQTKCQIDALITIQIAHNVT